MTPKKNNRHRIPDELIDQLLTNDQRPEDLTGKDGILEELTARLLGRALEGEMTEHLGYEKHAPRSERAAAHERAGAAGRSVRRSAQSAPPARRRPRLGRRHSGVRPAAR